LRNALQLPFETADGIRPFRDWKFKFFSVLQTPRVFRRKMAKEFETILIIKE
jgi:hypothetical protein